jgi:phosphatidylglycerol---prolipoprotein diacylglyceryl transferase
MAFALATVTLSSASRYLTSLDPGLVSCAALVAAFTYAVRSAKRSGLDPRSMYWAVVCSSLGGLFGGHLLDLFVHGWQGPYSLLQFWQGGKSLYGGLIVGGIVGGLFFHYRKLPVLAYADASMPALALGYAIGRLGCFLNGDDYGKLSNVPWAVAYPPGTEAYSEHVARGWINSGAPSSLPIHPVQLYASLIGLGMFLLLANWQPRRAGGRFCAFLILYGAARFCLEQWFRGDFRAVVGPFSLPQVFSMLFVMTGVAIWLRARESMSMEARSGRGACFARNGGPRTDSRRTRATNSLTEWNLPITGP